MRLSTLLFSFLCAISIRSTTAISNSGAIQPKFEDQNKHATLHVTSAAPLLDQEPGREERDLREGSFNFGRRESMEHEADNHESLVALCEAGSLTGCKKAIEEERAVAAATSNQDFHRSQSKSFFRQIFGELMALWDLFPFCISFLCIVVVCIAFVVRNYGRASLVAHPEKKAVTNR